MFIPGAGKEAVEMFKKITNKAEEDSRRGHFTVWQEIKARSKARLVIYLGMAANPFETTVELVKMMAEAREETKSKKS